MNKFAFDAFRLLRPRQWLKNVAVFAAPTFAGVLFEPQVFQKTILAFIVFCGLSSATYIINDLFDIKKDRLHPFKRFRPLAHGDISVTTGIIFALILLILSLIGSLSVTPAFFAVSIVYLLIQFLYSTKLKAIAAVDILAIAAGYILRVYGGEFATGYHISVWLLLTTISVSLFLAVGKRISELTLLTNSKQANIAETRKSLSHYSQRLLDSYAAIFATSTFISYSLFTFLETPTGFSINFDILMPDFLPAFFQRKWLMITIVPVVYGLMRYIQDIYEKNEGESPEKVLLSDRPLLTTVIIWMFLVIFVLYVVGP